MKYLTNTVNHCLKESTFPDELKQSKVITVYRNLTRYRKKNYRQESLLPRISKVFERVREREKERETVIYTQIDNFMNFMENKT